MDNRRTQAGLNLLVILLFAVILLLLLFPAEVGSIQDAAAGVIEPYGNEYGIDGNVQEMAADYSVYICPPAFIIGVILGWVIYNGGKKDE